MRLSKKAITKIAGMFPYGSVNDYDSIKEKLSKLEFAFEPGDDTQSNITVQDAEYWTRVYTRGR